MTPLPQSAANLADEAAVTASTEITPRFRYPLARIQTLAEALGACGVVWNPGSQPWSDLDDDDFLYAWVAGPEDEVCYVGKAEGGLGRLIKELSWVDPEEGNVHLHARMAHTIRLSGFSLVPFMAPVHLDVTPDVRANLESELRRAMGAADEERLDRALALLEDESGSASIKHCELLAIRTASHIAGAPVPGNAAGAGCWAPKKGSDLDLIDDLAIASAAAVGAWA